MNFLVGSATAGVLAILLVVLGFGSDVVARRHAGHPDPSECPRRVRHSIQFVLDLPVNDFTTFFIEDEEAVEEFKERVPDLARGLVEKIQQAHKDNARFQSAFEKFFDLCRTALNPNIRVEAVDEMLVQHLLTERLFRTIFNNPEFVKRNAIAAEVERVIDALVSHSFDRTEYLKSLDRFYRAIEDAARVTQGDDSGLPHPD